MILRRLLDPGLNRMRTFLDSFATTEPEAYATVEPILWDDTYSEPTPHEVAVDRPTFPTRYELAAYCCERVPQCGLADPERDAGLWAWLALLWFEQVCPYRSGRRRPGALDRWIADVWNPRRYYRHFVLGPFVVYRAQGDEPAGARALLANRVSVATGEVFRSFVESPIANCRPALSVATRLYFDVTSGRLRRGAGVKGPGGVRRLILVLQQFDRTYDLDSLEADQLFRMLPAEFRDIDPA